MKEPSRSTAADEFGDFQTPAELAARVCSLASRSRLEPATLIEPTCGAGNFLIAAIDRFAGVERAIGVEVKSKYVSTSRDKLRERPDSHKTSVIHKRFFHVDWKAIVDDSPEPILVVGNSPRVADSTLGAIRSEKTPKKTNIHNHKGLEAITGKSNFDISEWMIAEPLDTLGRPQNMELPANLCGFARSTSEFDLLESTPIFDLRDRRLLLFAVESRDLRVLQTFEIRRDRSLHGIPRRARRHRDHKRRRPAACTGRFSSI